MESAGFSSPSWSTAGRLSLTSRQACSGATFFAEARSTIGLTPYTLWSWTDSFDPDPDDPAATDRTDGPSYFDYFDINGWQAGGSPIGNFRGFMTYGARTSPENLPSGSATYEGRLRAEIWGAGQLALGHTGLGFAAPCTWRRISTMATCRGGIDALHFQPQGDARYPLPDGNVIDIASAPIDEAEIAAEWVGNDPNDNAAPHETSGGFSGTLIGEFYGPAADEVGGVLSGRRAATDTTPEQFLMGGFGGSQPDPEP